MPPINLSGFKGLLPERLSLRTRIFALLAASGLFVLIGVFSLMNGEQRRAMALNEGVSSEQRRMAGTLVSSEGSLSSAFAVSFTFWDDFVHMVATRDKKWADVNLIPAMAPFNTDGCWVYNLEKQRIYSTYTKGQPNLDDVQIPPEVMDKMLHDTHVSTFFLSTPHGPLQVCGATIHMTADSARTGKVYGYFFSLNLWDAKELEDIESHTGATVQILKPGQNARVLEVQDPNTGKSSFAIPLAGHDGMPVAMLQFTYANVFVGLINQWSQRSALMFTVLIATLFVVVTVGVVRWVVQPLQVVASALNLRDASVLQPLKKERDEFGEVARMIEDSFVQQSKVEEALKEKSDAQERAMAASRAKSEFLANMSHEIRTPMNGVVGMADLLLEGSLDESSREYVTIIRNSADSLMRIINDILDFSKIEAGKFRIDDTEFNLRDVIEEVCELLASSAFEKGIELVSHTADSVPAAMRGDPTRIRQVLLNLVGNAIKFTSEGEVVVTAVAEVTGNVATTRVFVRDTGIGISPERQADVFDSFTQEDGTTTRRYGGTGLGLTVSRRIVQLMGGALDLESKVGDGSIFKILLPLKIVGERRATVEIAAKSLRMLVVESNLTARSFLTNVLQSWGHTVSGVSSGNEALDLLRNAETPFDVVMVSGSLPVLEGLDAAMQIRHDPRHSNCRLLLMTAGKPIAGGKANVFDGQINKPIRRERLAQIIGIQPSRHVADRRTALKPASSLNVLLAEDNQVNQMVAIRLLQSRGHKVTAVNNGLEAVEAVKAGSFDLVLMDCQMPVMDGYEATQSIRLHEKENKLPRMPIIALTANALVGEDKLCYLAGMDDYLSKPVRPESMGAMLAKWNRVKAAA
jgi:signal transduction histidine kinase/CheY-like chemotaxis protein